MLRLHDYPQLRVIAWNRGGSDVIGEEEALALYERHWRHVDTHALTPDEAALLERLVKIHGNGCFAAL